MIEATVCAASLSLCYTARCDGINECIGSWWCMGDSKCKDSTLHIRAEQTQLQWRQPLLVCGFHEDYNRMACGICTKVSVLLVAKPLPQLAFPFYTCIVGVNPRPGMLIDTVTDKRLYCFRPIRMSCTNITKYIVRVLDRHPSEKCPELIKVWYHIRASEIVHA